MTLKDKMKTYNFWISLVSAILLTVKVVGDKYGFIVDSNLVMDITTGVCSVFVILGIITSPTKANSKSIGEKIIMENNNIESEKTNASSYNEIFRQMQAHSEVEEHAFDSNLACDSKIENEQILISENENNFVEFEQVNDEPGGSVIVEEIDDIKFCPESDESVEENQQEQIDGQEENISQVEVETVEQIDDESLIGQITNEEDCEAKTTNCDFDDASTCEKIETMVEDDLALCEETSDTSETENDACLDDNIENFIRSAAALSLEDKMKLLDALNQKQ